MKRIFVISWSLIVLFFLSAISGFGLHIAGHGNNHEVWHNWAVFHVVDSVLFLVAIIFHVTTHRGWYKGIIKKGIGRKSKLTVVLSVIVLLLSVTGIVLFGVNGAYPTLGLCHYKIGVITTVIIVGHIIKRLPALYKPLKK